MAGMHRESVYWGVEPYPRNHEGFETPYPGWQQSHASDLGDADFNAIVKSAREWLQQPMLKDATEGLLPDVRFRAALDLALQTTGGGKYGMGLHPAQYNTLLARLAGVSEKGTLLTIREASENPPVESLYHPRRERSNMRASARIRQYASKFASENPEVAFDLLDLATKVAEDEQKDEKTQDEGQAPAPKTANQGQEQAQDPKDEQNAKKAYLALKSACIRCVSENPESKQAFMPVLKLIKQIG